MKTITTNLSCPSCGEPWPILCIREPDSKRPFVECHGCGRRYWKTDPLRDRFNDSPDGRGYLSVILKYERR